MKVRLATANDLDDTVSLLVESYGTTEYSARIEPDRESMSEVVAGMILNPHAVIYLAETDDDRTVGCVGALAHGLWLNKSHTIAQEFFWYVQPDHRRSKAGKLLMAQLESWAKAINASALCVASANSKHQKRMNQIFEKQGFTETETQFTKEL